ncbi:MAG: hypothetical protein KTR31_16525 [Myxococcales bacterium]|nr:hypothetical protein [Myxococcales bacterium]
MARTHDGIQTPLPPSPTGIGLGLAVLIGGIAASFFFLCAGIPIVIVGLLMLVNQLNGKSRVRLTFSKLLVENERLVMGFLVGPAKQRVAWPDLKGVEVTDGVVVVTSSTGDALRLGEGCPDDELQELKARIEESAQRYADEGGA